MSKGKFTVGAIFGAIAGVVTGVLTAPKSGKETRAEIKAKVGEVKSTATVKVDELKDEAVDLRNRAKSAANAAKESFKSEK